MMDRDISTHALVSISELEFLLKLPRKQLRGIAKTAGRHYNPFDFYKSGTDKWRHIDNPDSALKNIQKNILKNILNKRLYLLPQNMTGGVSGKSVIENAKIHIGKACVGIIDIKECFPSTNHKKVYELWKNFFGCGSKTAGALTQLTTFQDRLPQGAPTSPLLCNFILMPIYKEIENYTNKHALDFSIFVDDITISGTKKDVLAAVNAIVKILLKHQYAVRNKKVKIFSSAFRQKVTGITVNNKLSLGRNGVNEIRKLIIETAKLKDYIPTSYLARIRGKTSFAKYLSPKHGISLEKFAEKLLVAPILNIEKEKSDDKRSCNSYKVDHHAT
ncbi:MAG: reverse transcriptase family protein [Candidatus Paceibacterota bacterium]